MASDADTLQTAYSNFCNILAQITANPRPTYSLDGKSVSWNEYYSMILSNMENVRRQMIFAAGPFEVRSTVT